MNDQEQRQNHLQAPHQNCSGLILAGGYSRRFGSDKALHPVRGATMIERVYLTLSSVLTPILISTRSKKQTYNLPVKHVIDRYAGQGPLAGLHAGMKAVDTPWIFIAAVDMPLIEASLITTILDETTDDVEAVITQTGDRLQPLFGCYRVSLADAVEERLQAKMLSATRFAMELKAKRIRLPALPLTNINRPTDL